MRRRAATLDLNEKSCQSFRGGQWGVLDIFAWERCSRLVLCVALQRSKYLHQARAACRPISFARNGFLPGEPARSEHPMQARWMRREQNTSA